MSAKASKGARSRPQGRTERAARIAAILSHAQQTFGNKAKSDAWLRRPSSAVGGRRPIDLLDSETGCNAVEQLLYRIDHGIAV